MGRSSGGREKIGELLVGLGVITRAQLEEALATQAEERLGKCLVRLGYVSETKLIQTLSQQLSVPWVSLERVEFSAALLARIPAALADRHLVMPVYFRSGRGQPETLYVAMDDPTDEVAITEIARAAKLRVRPMIAAPTDLRRAIEERYFGAATGEVAIRAASLPTDELAKAEGPRTEAPRKRVRDAGRAPARVPPPPPAKPLLRNDGVVPVDKYATPSSPPEAAPRTLTFLDGTQLRLPNAGKRAPAQLPVTRVRHVVKAVTAAGSAAAADALKWDEVLEAVLEALQARGVTLTRGEIGEAWERVRARAQARNDASAAVDPARTPVSR